MKEFVKAILVLGVLLVLGVSARVAIYTHLHSDAAAVTHPASIAATDRGCGDMAVKLTCLQHTDPRS